MGLFRRKPKAEGKQGPDLSWLFPILLVLILVLTAIGLGTWIWSTISTHDQRVKEEAVASLLRVSVTEEGSYLPAQLSYSVSWTAAADASESVRAAAEAAGIPGSSISDGIAAVSVEGEGLRRGRLSTSSAGKAVEAYSAIIMIPGVKEAFVSVSPADQARAEAEALSAAYRNAYSAAQLAVTAFPDGYEPRVLEFAVNGYETDPSSGEVTCRLTMMMAAEEAGGV